MKEESRDLYRIDPLKVRKKIFESYPAGSKQRKEMIKEEKLKELGHLRNIFVGMPIEITNDAIENIKSSSLLLLVKAFFFTLVAFILALFITTLTLSPVEIFMSSVGTVVFSFLSLKSFLLMYVNYKLIKDFSDRLQEMEEKISKLQRDIFDEPGL